MEWSTLFLRYFVGPDSYIFLVVATTLLISLSSVILMNFCLRIELCYHNFNRRIRYIPIAVFVCYLLIGFFLLARGRIVVRTIHYLERAARIGIAFPAAVLLALDLHDSSGHHVYLVRYGLRFSGGVFLQRNQQMGTQRYAGIKIFFSSQNRV